MMEQEKKIEKGSARGGMGCKREREKERKGEREIHMNGTKGEIENCGHARKVLSPMSILPFRILSLSHFLSLSVVFSLPKLSSLLLSFLFGNFHGMFFGGGIRP